MATLIRTDEPSENKKHVRRGKDSSRALLERLSEVTAATAALGINRKMLSMSLRS